LATVVLVGTAVAWTVAVANSPGAKAFVLEPGLRTWRVLPTTVALRTLLEGTPEAWKTSIPADPWTSVKVESNVAFAEPRLCELTVAGVHGAGLPMPQFLMVI
jgi:hypothetical protein